MVLILALWLYFLSGLPFIGLDFLPLDASIVSNPIMHEHLRLLIDILQHHIEFLSHLIHLELVLLLIPSLSGSLLLLRSQPDLLFTRSLVVLGH